MEALASLIHGLTIACQPINLLYALVGVLLGTAVGVLPGIGPALTVALLLPITFKLDPAGSLIMFAGIYYGGMYGGSTTSILINTPGESASMVTALEGNKMAKAGRGGPALATAAIGSFVAGTIATLGIVFLAPWLVEVAVNFGPEDYFALMCVAFVTVSATFGDSPIRGLTSLMIGLALGLVGIDKLSGQARLSFGVPDLLDGVEVTTLAVGLFAVGVRPGIGPSLRVALRMPVTYKLDPGGSLIMFAGIYYGGMYGGSTTAILINTPGESASMATALEGNKMAKAGRGGPALATAAIGSFVAGTFATAGLTFLAPWLVEVAVKFGPED